MSASKRQLSSRVDVCPVAEPPFLLQCYWGGLKEMNCHQIVTKDGAKWKENKPRGIRAIPAKLRLAKRFRRFDITWPNC